MTMIAPAIVIAAGGAGRRMGGGKPLRPLAGHSLLDRAIAIAQAQSDCIALAVREPDQLPASDLPLLCDARPSIGPISALDSGFRFARAQGRQHLLLIGCDQPFLPGDLVATLTAAIAGHDVAMPVINEHYQPLAALWRVDQPALDAYVQAGGTSLYRFASTRDLIPLQWPDAPDDDPFANLNDRDALAEAERRLTRPA